MMTYREEEEASGDRDSGSRREAAPPPVALEYKILSVSLAWVRKSPISRIFQGNADAKPSRFLDSKKTALESHYVYMYT